MSLFIGQLLDKVFGLGLFAHWELPVLTLCWVVLCFASAGREFYPFKIGNYGQVVRSFPTVGKERKKKMLRNVLAND